MPSFNTTLPVIITRCTESPGYGSRLVVDAYTSEPEVAIDALHRYFTSGGKSAEHLVSFADYFKAQIDHLLAEELKLNDPQPTR